jgi:putative DNA primase/helicase
MIAAPNANAIPLAAALAYRRAELSVIPVKADGSKQPAWEVLPREPDPERPDRLKATWKPFMKRIASEEEIRGWFASDQVLGLAVITGAVSGNLEILDFDYQAETIFPEFCKLVEETRQGLIGVLSIGKSPKPGFHVRYHCLDVKIPGNEALARDPARPKSEQTLIELRGEGSYTLAPGCPAACHSTGRLYEHHSGPKLTQAPTITATEREVLIATARYFDRWPQTEAPEHKTAAQGTRAGDDFNHNGWPWEQILVGWTRVGDQLWRRPGKDKGSCSATTCCRAKEGGHELLHVFSTNAAPFEPGGSYSKFSAYTLLHHGGDFKAAAAELRRQGFGAQASPDPEAPGATSDITIAALIEKHVPEQWQLTHRAEGKVWSAAKREYLGHTDFVQRSLWSWLRDQAAVAKDAPHYRKGGLNPNALISAMKRELSVLWASLLETLPDLEDVPADSELGRGFRLALIRMWTVPRLNEAIRLSNGEHLPQSASLASKARRMSCEGSTGWRRLHEGYDAWARLEVDPDGRVDATLGMTWKLALQMSVPLPTVFNQKDLIRLGTRFDLIDAEPSVPTSTSYGKQRVAVLTRALRDELLQEATDEVESQEATDEVES